MRTRYLNFNVGDYILFSDKDENLFVGKSAELGDKLAKVIKEYENLLDAPNEEIFILNKLAYNDQLQGYDIDETQMIEKRVNTLFLEMTTSQITLDQLANQIQKS